MCRIHTCNGLQYIRKTRACQLVIKLSIKLFLYIRFINLKVNKNKLEKKFHVMYSSQIIRYEIMIKSFIMIYALHCIAQCCIVYTLHHWLRKTQSGDFYTGTTQTILILETHEIHRTSLLLKSHNIHHRCSTYLMYF